MVPTDDAQGRRSSSLERASVDNVGSQPANNAEANDENQIIDNSPRNQGGRRWLFSMTMSAFFLISSVLAAPMVVLIANKHGYLSFFHKTTETSSQGVSLALITTTATHNPVTLPKPANFNMLESTTAHPLRVTMPQSLPRTHGTHHRDANRIRAYAPVMVNTTQLQNHTVSPNATRAAVVLVQSITQRNILAPGGIVSGLRSEDKLSALMRPKKANVKSANARIRASQAKTRSGPTTRHVANHTYQSWTTSGTKPSRPEPVDGRESSGVGKAAHQYALKDRHHWPGAKRTRLRIKKLGNSTALSASITSKPSSGLSGTGLLSSISLLPSTHTPQGDAKLPVTVGTYEVRNFSEMQLLPSQISEEGMLNGTELGTGKPPSNHTVAPLVIGILKDGSTTLFFESAPNATLFFPGCFSHLESSAPASSKVRNTSSTLQHFIHAQLRNASALASAQTQKEEFSTQRSGVPLHTEQFTMRKATEITKITKVGVWTKVPLMTDPSIPSSKQSQTTILSRMSHSSFDKSNTIHWTASHHGSSTGVSPILRKTNATSFPEVQAPISYVTSKVTKERNLVREHSVQKSVTGTMKADGKQTIGRASNSNASNPALLKAVLLKMYALNDTVKTTVLKKNATSSNFSKAAKRENTLSATTDHGRRKLNVLVSSTSHYIYKTPSSNSEPDLRSSTFSRMYQSNQLNSSHPFLEHKFSSSPPNMKVISTIGRVSSGISTSGTNVRANISLEVKVINSGKGPGLQSQETFSFSTVANNTANSEENSTESYSNATPTSSGTKNATLFSKIDDDDDDDDDDSDEDESINKANSTVPDAPSTIRPIIRTSSQSHVTGRGSTGSLLRFRGNHSYIYKPRGRPQPRKATKVSKAPNVTTPRNPPPPSGKDDDLPWRSVKPRRSTGSTGARAAIGAENYYDDSNETRSQQSLDEDAAINKRFNDEEEGRARTSTKTQSVVRTDYYYDATTPYTEKVRHKKRQIRLHKYPEDDDVDDFFS